MPVCELTPDAPASKAMGKIADKIDKIIDLFNNHLDTPSS
jgi:hypothetical protein